METKRFENKVALVTGAASGIGRATARMLADEGATVFVADIDLEATKAVTDGDTLVPLSLNVTDESSWQTAIETVLAQHERLDVVVNNAGVSFAKPTDEMTLEEWRRLMAVNLDGVFLGTKYAIKAMKSNGGGSIVNMASVSGITPSATAAAYCASKAAVRMFSKAVAIECSDNKTGIRINVVTPGGVKTPMWEKQEFFQQLVAQHGGVDKAFATMAGTPSKEFFSPEDVARTILYLVSDESSHLTGTEIVLDQGHTS